MVIFNLFPWRVQKKKYEDRWTVAIVFLAVTSVVLFALSVHFWLINAEQKSHFRIETLEDELQLVMLKKQISLSDHDSELPVATIKKMNMYRAATKNLFAELTRSKQKTVCFSGMTRVKNHIYFTGYARSAADFTEYLKSWPAANLFSEITIEALKLDSQRNQMQFRFLAIENQSF